MTEATSKGLIKGLLSKAWAKAKAAYEKAKAKAKSVVGKARAKVARPKKSEVESKERKRIAIKTGRSVSQVRAIEKGERPGRNLQGALKSMKAGRPVRAPRKISKPTPAKKAPAPTPRRIAKPAKVEAPALSPVQKFEARLGALYDNDR